MSKDVLKSYDIPHIERVAQLLSNDPTKHLTISDLAQEVGINSSKLRSGFKKLYNQSIYQFRLSLRLKLVIELLEDTNLPLKQIAYKTGFDSRDSLGRCFRRRFRLSPREWRNVQSIRPEAEVIALASLALPRCN